MGTTTVTLPHGAWDGQRHRRRATLRAPTGEDEEALRESAHHSPARRATLLLARCLVALEDAEGGEQLARDLSLGDRDALLLHLRRMSLGERLSCVVRCPAPACGKGMDVQLRVGDLLAETASEPRAWDEAVVGLADGPATLRLRRVTAADQEVAARVVTADPDAAVGILLARCVRDARGQPLPEDAWTPEARAEVAARLAALDPHAELWLSPACPHCGEGFRTLFEPGPFLFAELAGRAFDLDREVHLLAYHYHWSPRDILALPRPKRRRYLDLLLDALAEGDPR